MRIVYVAKHGSGDNDDEGAILHALTSLGHDVQRLTEEKGRKAGQVGGDFLLFHKWEDFDSLSHVKMPKVFWYFDLVDYPMDPTIASRCCRRRWWMEQVIPRVDLGFCTDGDWVEQDKSGKLVLLRQGADTRYAGMGQKPLPYQSSISLLFTGIRGGGSQRMSWVDEMEERYGPAFHRVTGLHGRALADRIASAEIVLAPDGPITNLYWSNRVYLMLGFGAFLMHPYCSEIAKEYQHGTEILFYNSRQELHSLIDEWVDGADSTQHNAIAQGGLLRTLAQHTYTHRCQRMIEIVKERGIA